MATENVHHQRVTNPQPRKSGLPPRLSQQLDVAYAKLINRHSEIPNISTQELQEYTSGSKTRSRSEELRKELDLLDRQEEQMFQLAQDAKRGQYDPANAGNDTSNGGGTLPDTQVNDPASRETIQTHYTISEDEIGKGLQNKLAALALKTGAPRRIEPSSHLGTAQPVPTPSTALSDNKREPPNLLQKAFPELRRSVFPIVTLESQQEFRSHNPASTVQRQKLPERVSWSFEATQGTHNIRQTHGYRYSPANLSETLDSAGEGCSEPGLFLGLSACAATPNSSDYIQTAIPETYQVPDGAISESLSAEETSLLCFDVIQKMKQRIQLLEAANEELRQIPTPQVAIRMQIFHCLENEDTDENIYLSEP